MPSHTRPGARVAPLADWSAIHPAALAWSTPSSAAHPALRSAALAEALVARNQAWGNAIGGEMARWLQGAEAVVTGQQPGLLGGPLLALVKACAVAAEVRRRRTAGREAVGFFWLATGDDDLPEMGWARVAQGETLLEAREESWRRGQGMASGTALGGAAADLLARLGEGVVSDHAREAVELAASCYATGTALGEANGRFFARLLRGLGVVLVDAREKEVARAAVPAIVRVLEHLPAAWEALEEGGRSMRAKGWPRPLALVRGRLPVFRAEGNVRRRLASHDGACPAEVVRELEDAPERFVPNVWLRPLQQDAALGTSLALLGGAELAYHAQAYELWDVAGVPRPEWRLRPHVTVVSAAERRLAAQLGVEPHELLSRHPPRRVMAGRGVSREAERLRQATSRGLERLRDAAREGLPALAGDVDATERKLAAALAWLEGRIVAAAARAGEVEMQRWSKLRAFLRPESRPQERRLSVLAPLLRMGLEWPGQLAAAVDPLHPGMHLLFWGEGGAW
jgi:uncharacterized protein YllA (UPF0747 family)